MKTLINKFEKIQLAISLFGCANWYQGIDKPTFYQWIYKWRLSWKTSWDVATGFYG